MKKYNFFCILTLSCILKRRKYQGILHYSFSTKDFHFYGLQIILGGNKYQRKYKASLDQSARRSNNNNLFPTAEQHSVRSLQKAQRDKLALPFLVPSRSGQPSTPSLTPLRTPARLEGQGSQALPRRKRPKDAGLGPKDRSGSLTAESGSCPRLPALHLCRAQLSPGLPSPERSCRDGPEKPVSQGIASDTPPRPARRCKGRRPPREESQAGRRWLRRESSSGPKTAGACGLRLRATAGRRCTFRGCTWKESLRFRSLKRGAAAVLLWAGAAQPRRTSAAGTPQPA